MLLSYITDMDAIRSTPATISLNIGHVSKSASYCFSPYRTVEWFLLSIAAICSTVSPYLRSLCDKMNRAKDSLPLRLSLKISSNETAVPSQTFRMILFISICTGVISTIRIIRKSSYNWWPCHHRTSCRWRLAN